MPLSHAPLRPLAGVHSAERLLSHGVAPQGWQLRTFCGRLSELSGDRATASLSLAFDLVLDAQRTEEPCAWITTRQSAFFPPDAAARGVDLEALAVIRATQPRSIGRAADHLARSGAFGLIVVDLASIPSLTQRPILDPVPMPLQSRLLGLAQSHDLALLFLTRKAAEDPSLSSLISLRAQVRRRTRPDGSQLCEAHAIKDKRHAPDWRHLEVCIGPAGLR